MAKPTFNIFVPTRDSADRILPFLAAYRKIGIEPLYVVDTRSQDGTIDVLRSEGASFVEFSPQSDFVECGMIEYASKFMECEWALRLDDDEFPSLDLLNWIASEGVNLKASVCAVSRRDVFRQAGDIKYIRMWPYYWSVERPDFLNAQMRFYRHRDVEYIDKIHTPGLSVGKYVFAPEHAYFIHLDTIVRNISQRIAKMQRYDEISKGAGWKMGFYYLPELLSLQDLNLEPIATTEFDCLIENIRSPSQPDAITLEVASLRTMLEGPFDRSQFLQNVAERERLEAERERLEAEQVRLETERERLEKLQQSLWWRTKRLPLKLGRKLRRYLAFG